MTIAIASPAAVDDITRAPETALRVDGPSGALATIGEANPPSSRNAAATSSFGRP